MYNHYQNFQLLRYFFFENITKKFIGTYYMAHIKQNDTTRVTYQPPKGALQVYMFHSKQVIKG